ncbi:MAG: rhodanese-like domain-containing protein [Eggerthellaceae bacterium]|nr:rhodanese-like domain-containing protein [Eggerthellaceae bacterium]
MFIKQITPAELLASIQAGDEQVIIDIRDRASYVVGHVPGAISNPADGFDGSMFASIDPTTRIVIICYRGVMSKQVAQYLESHGFANVVSMKSGMSGWHKLHGAPIERVTE